MQRLLNCGTCGRQFAVPDNYFRANIQCPACGAIVDRRTGAPPQAAPLAAPQPQMQGPAPMSLPQYAPYPAQFPQYPSYAAPRCSRTGLVIGLVVGGVMLAGVIAAVAIGAAISASVDATGTWYHYVSEQGEFEVDLPAQPVTVSEPSEPGSIGGPLQRAYHETWGTSFEASYFDLGDQPESWYEYNYNEAADAMAQAVNGKVTSRENREVEGYAGMLVKISDVFDLRATYLLLRVGNRVYIVGAENHDADQQAAADRVISSFKLRNPPELTDPLRPYRTVGNTWTQRTTVNLQGIGTQVTYMRAEVLSVESGTANVRFTTFDAKMKETHSSITPMQLVAKPAPGPVGPMPKMKRETIQVPAGKFECSLFETAVTRTWTCRKTGLFVKSEFESGVSELIEYQVK